MAQTRRDIINQAIRILDLTGGTNAPTVAASDGNPANVVYTGDQTFTDYINDGAAQCAMTCLPLWDTGTKAAFTVGTVYYTDLALTSGNRLWAIEGEGVKLGANRVIRGAKGFVDANSGMGSTTTPFLYWYPLGQTGLTVVGNPTPTAAVLSVYGLAVPKPVVGDNDTFPVSWLKPDDTYTIALYAAARLAEKRAADSILGARSQSLWAAYEARVEQHRARLTDTERSLMVAMGDGRGAI